MSHKGTKMGMVSRAFRQPWCHGRTRLTLAQALYQVMLDFCQLPQQCSLQRVPGNDMLTRFYCKIIASATILSCELPYNVDPRGFGAGLHVLDPSHLFHYPSWRKKLVPGEICVVGSSSVHSSQPGSYRLFWLFLGKPALRPRRALFSN